MRERIWLRIWRWPLGLAMLTVFGLVAALLGHEAVWWGVSWVALGTPLVVILVCLLRS